MLIFMHEPARDFFWGKTDSVTKSFETFQRSHQGKDVFVFWFGDPEKVWVGGADMSDG